MSQPPARKPIGTPFIELESVDSTNNYARGLLDKAGLSARQPAFLQLPQHGTVVFAHDQVQGKGQRGKTWTTEKGANIAMSILIDPAPLLVTEQFYLSACVAITLQDFFSKYTGDLVKIKWPNDLYWQDRKAGGVLIESGVRSLAYRQAGSELGVTSNKHPVTWAWAIIGIGININQTSFPPGLINPVSLKQITGKGFDTVTLAKEICHMFDNYFQQLSTKGFDAIYAQYLQYLYKKDEKVKLKKDNRVFEATIKSVSRTGELITHHAIEERFANGEVELQL